MPTLTPYLRAMLTLLLLAAGLYLFLPSARGHDPAAMQQWANRADVRQAAYQHTFEGWGCYIEKVMEANPSKQQRAECWRPLATLATQAYPVAGGVDAMLRVVACESAGNPLAVGGIGELGLAQHHPRYLPARLERVGLPPVEGLGRQPWPNLLAAAELAHRAGWQPWTCQP